MRIIGIAACLLLWFTPPALAAGPPVKKSTSGICHERGSSFYERTKNFEPYESMEACVQSGGRQSKVAAAAEEKKTAWVGKLIFIGGALVIVAGAFFLFRRKAAN